MRIQWGSTKYQDVLLIYLFSFATRMKCGAVLPNLQCQLLLWEESEVYPEKIQDFWQSFLTEDRVQVTQWEYQSIWQKWASKFN